MVYNNPYEKRSKKPLFSCEECKVLCVVGEDTAQIVSTTRDILMFPAHTILKIDVDLLHVTDHIFTDKIVKQGILQKQIQYCSSCSIKRCQLVEVPFVVTAHIPGVEHREDLDIQNKILLIETDEQLLDPYTIEIKAVIDIQVKASRYVQKRIKVCHTNVINHSLISG